MKKFDFDKPRHETIAWNIIKTNKKQVLIVFGYFIKEQNRGLPKSFNIQDVKRFGYLISAFLPSLVISGYHVSLRLRYNSVS